MTEETTGEAPEVEANALATDEGANSVSPTDGQPESDGEAAPDGESSEQAEKPEKKVPDDVQEAINARISEITRKRREAERRAERAEKKLRELEGRDLNDLDYEDQIAEKTLARSRREQLENDRETAQELALEAYQARVEIAAQKYSDYAEVVGNPSLPITPAMAEAIMDSEVGPDVAYFLGKNPKEAARISQLNPVSQARELGRLEAIVSTQRQTPKPAAAPVQPVGARSAPVRKDPTKMSMAEYIAWRNGK